MALQSLRQPTRDEWYRAVAGLALDGERHVERLSPDGSSVSFDSIQGIRIGRTSVLYAPDSFLPANRHDFRHWYARNHEKVPWERWEIDAEYRDGCLDEVSVLIGWSGWKARKICWARYYGLRLFGRAAYGHKWWGLGPRVVQR